MVKFTYLDRHWANIKKDYNKKLDELWSQGKVVYEDLNVVDIIKQHTNEHINCTNENKQMNKHVVLFYLYFVFNVSFRIAILFSLSGYCLVVTRYINVSQKMFDKLAWNICSFAFSLIADMIFSS